jgi:hypothetical protein
MGLVFLLTLAAGAALNELLRLALQFPSFWWLLFFYLPLVVYTLAFTLFSFHELRITISEAGIEYRTAAYRIFSRWENLIRAEQASVTWAGSRQLVLSQPTLEWDPWFGYNYRFSPFRKQFLQRFRRTIPIGPLVWENNDVLEQLIDQYAPHILL